MTSYPAHFALLLMLALYSHVVRSAGPDEWAQRRIYQVVTDRFARPANDTQSCNLNDYCGGTFAALEDRLPYIAGMGFNAIWISPVIVNYPRGYHGYWATDFFAINPHFGTAAQLKNFVQAAHAMDIWIMVDIVVNHVGPVGNDFSGVSPFNRSEYYHTRCAVTQYVCGTHMVYDCRLDDLPDLNQTVPYVTEQLQKYVLWLLGEFGFDGIRADTVMYIENPYWVGLQKAAKAYIVGEVWSNFACNLNYVQNGVDATLNYPLYYTIRSVYQSSSSMYELGTTWRQMQQYPHPNWEVNFLDNQDNDRFLTAGTPVPLYKSALAHMFFINGIPCVYYGTEDLMTGTSNNNENRQPMWTTGYPENGMMYQFLKNLSAAHATFEPWKYEVLERWRDDTIYCYVRGSLLVCTTNQVGNSQTRTIPNLPFDGKKLCNWLNDAEPCRQGSSTMTITVPSSGDPLVLWAKSS